MKHFILFQALGDNLISISLLEQLDEKINILGTKHTKNIVKLMNLEDKFNIKVIFNDIPAFYDIRKQGVFKALKDFSKFVKYIRNNDISEIAFEKKDFRSIMVSFLTNVKVHPTDNTNPKVYENRKENIEKVYKKKIVLNKYLLKIYTSKVIVINPLTRVEFRNIKHNHLKYIIDELNKNDYEVYLIDIEKKYQEFESEVQYYLTNTTLNDVKKLILKSDLYIGADSFLIHLAYYLKRNYFMIFYRDNDDFLPSNISNDFYLKANECSNFNEELKRKFKNIGLID
jgi:ADP-heptose:LPS heptosyltransferase